MSVVPQLQTSNVYSADHCCCGRKLQLYSSLMQVLREKMHEIIVSAYLDYDRNLQLYKCLYHRPSGHLVLTKIV